jgi:beta-alanine--pyruvate transaminase
MGGVVCRAHVYEAIMSVPTPAHVIEFSHGYTYSGHPVACAAAVATMKLLADEKLFERAAAMGPVLGNAVHTAIKGLPNVIGIRALGLAAAVELSPSDKGVGARGYAVFLECLKHGVLVRSAGDNLVLAPAYVVEKAQIEQMVDVLAQAIKRVA